MDFTAGVVCLCHNEGETGFGEVEIRLDGGEQVEIEGVLQGSAVVFPALQCIMDGIEFGGIKSDVKPGAD